MFLELLTIGDELLLGLTVDTNAAWLARELAAEGVSIVRRASVGDDAAVIADAVGDALRRTGAVVTTGGLGPTADDVTRTAIAGVFGRELRFDDAQWERLREMWRERGRAGEPPAANRQQVMIPEGATILENRHGSAPGIFLEDAAGRWVAMLPGVPREMRGMYADAILPIVRSRAGVGAGVVRTQTVRTTGVAESQIPELLGDAARGLEGMALAYLPGAEGVDLRLTVRGVSAEEADDILQRGATTLAERLGRAVYAWGATDLAAVVLDRCRAGAMRLAVAESCTGGLLGARLTSISGASDVFLGGVIAYDNSVKIRDLGVLDRALAENGAVSETVAEQMATGVRRRFGTEIGVGITGVAGPGGGTAEKPVGLVWIAVDVQGDVRTLGGRLIGDRDEVRLRATQAALEMIRRALAD